MSDLHLMPPPTPDLYAARRQFVELYGSIQVMNTYLKIAVLSLCGVCLGLIALNIKTYQTFCNFKPLEITESLVSFDVERDQHQNLPNFL